ncbi:hypothetical protein FHR53_001642 [Xanthomonas arboricola]|nr:hypothetical protein [Xanthomonas cannabis]NIK01200.1 hypothetical protein [Xanthomonas cannabis]NIK65196.1 hypothetical protein [Xanthomonas cannabis]
MTGAAQRARFRGCLLGLAVGDALGTTLEFCAPGSFTPIDDMRGGGPFALQAGQHRHPISSVAPYAHRSGACHLNDRRAARRRAGTAMCG